MPRRKRKHQLDIALSSQQSPSSGFVVDLRKVRQEKLEKQEKNPQVRKTREINFSVKKSFKSVLRPIISITAKTLGLAIWLVLWALKKILQLLLALSPKKGARHLSVFWQTIKQISLKKIWPLRIKTKQQLKNRLKDWPTKDLKRPFKKLAVNTEVKSNKPWTWKSGFGFVLALFVLALIFKLLTYHNLLNLPLLEAKIEDRSQSAIENLIFASDKAKSLELSEATGYFSKAGEDFLAAQTEVAKIDSFIFSLAKLSDNPKIKVASQGEKFLAAGVETSNLGEELGLALGAIFDNQDNLDVAIQEFLDHGHKASEAAKNLNVDLLQVDINVLPEEYRDKFMELKRTSLIMEAGLSEFVDLAEGLKPFLGLEKDKRYLLIFQNNTEMRASGGFMGSFALLDMKNGQIKNLEVPSGGTYDTEAGLNILVQAPKPLWLVNPLWHFWDANWWPDWKQSAQNIMWFYEKSDGPTVDGVISFTPTVLERLLRILGPVDLSEDYGVVIDADNFWEIIQPIVEEKTVELVQEDQTIVVQNTEPKKIIGDMMDKLIADLPNRLDQNTLLSIISSLEDSLAEKQVLLYFIDSTMQAQAEKHSWAGRIKDNRHDYLSVINTNIAGQKTDRKIRQEIEHNSQVQPDGSIIDTVKITRYHTGEKQQQFTGARNVNWMRVYVPVGSELISADGFEQPDQAFFEYPEEGWLELDSLKNEDNAQINFPSLTKSYTEDNKTVFANWSMVDPGQTEVITLQYKLPFNFYDLRPAYTWQEKLKLALFGQEQVLVPYSLLIQKQPGDLYTTVSSVLKLNDEDYDLILGHPQNLVALDTGWAGAAILDQDKYFGALWKKHINK